MVVVELSLVGRFHKVSLVVELLVIRRATNGTEYQLSLQIHDMLNAMIFAEIVLVQSNLNLLPHHTIAAAALALPTKLHSEKPFKTKQRLL